MLPVGGSGKGDLPSYTTQPGWNLQKVNNQPSKQKELHHMTISQPLPRHSLYY